MIIKGQTYDRLKWVAQVGLPALGTLYFALAGIWGLPSAEQVVGTIVAVDTFLGVILHISSNNFTANTAKGVMMVEDTETGGKKYSLEFNGDPDIEMEGKDRVIFEKKKT